LEGENTNIKKRAGCFSKIQWGAGAKGNTEKEKLKRAAGNQEGKKIVKKGGFQRKKVRIEKGRRTAT